eukprot:223745_1
MSTSATLSNHMPKLSIIYTALIAINTLILTPIVLFYTQKLRTLSNDPKQTLLSKRHPKSIIFLIITMLIYSVVCLPIAITPGIIQSINYGLGLISFFFGKSWYICCNIACYRLWLLYYEYTRGIHLKSTLWESQITKHTQHEYWTLKYNKLLSHKFSIFYWILGAVIYLLIIGIALLMGFVTTNPMHHRAFDVTLIVLYTMILIIAASKIRTCRDECFFLDELKRFGILCILFLILYLILWLLLFNYISLQLFLILVYVQFTMLFIFPFCLIATKWVINENQRRMSYAGNTNDKIKFRDIIRNEVAFELFAGHMINEFAIENLLFLFETTYFKQHCLQGQLIDNADDFYPQIVFGKPYNKNKCVDFRYIFERYIDERSEQCINISSQIRKDLKNIYLLMQQTTNHHFSQSTIESIQIELGQQMQPNQITTATPSVENGNNNVDVEECIHLLDKAMIEIESLIKNNFSRFTRTQEFKRRYPFKN